MLKSQCFSLGYIVKPFGLNGEMLIIIDADQPEIYAEIESVFISQKDQLAPYLVEYLSWANDRILLKLEDIDSADEAEKLRKGELYLPLTDLPKLPEGEFYFHELVGCEIKDAVKGSLGKVESIYDIPSNEQMAIIVNGKEVLIPIQKAFIVKFDKVNKVIEMNLPEGLIEVFTEEDDEK
jgi:16S rRNA processing protein RimM